MNNPLKILLNLDNNLTQPETLTIYGKAAIVLGFPNHAEKMGNDAITLDVDAILPMESLKAISQNMDFWDALAKTNEDLEADGLYMTHLFQEDQVILSPGWKSKRITIDLGFDHLKIQRPSTLDLILTKMMRGRDPKDMEDIKFLLSSEKITVVELEENFKTALIPDILEIKAAFIEAQPSVLEMASDFEKIRRNRSTKKSDPEIK